MSEISKLPWMSLEPVDFDSIRIFSGNKYIGSIGASDDPREITEANARHIVKCVNVHDELVAALEKCLAVIPEAANQDINTGLYVRLCDAHDAIVAALSKAKE